MKYFVKGKIARTSTVDDKLFINFEDDNLFGFPYEMKIPEGKTIETFFKYGVGDEIIAEVEYEEDCEGVIVAARILDPILLDTAEK
jgi:hypothetical protein